MVDKIWKVDQPFIRQGYIAQMMSLLVRKAMVLLKYVESVPLDLERSELAGSEKKNSEESNPDSPQRSPRPVVVEPREDTQLPPQTKKRIRTDLGLPDESCFNLLLGVAEKLKPGIYFAVNGNSAWIEEKLKSSLLATFCYIYN